MPYQISTIDNRIIRLSETSSVVIDLNLLTSTITVNEKKASFSSVGYQALYGISFFTHVTLSPIEVDAIRECIHGACRWSLDYSSENELIYNSCYDSNLSIDLIILNADLSEHYIRYKLIDIKSERVNVVPPNIFTSTEKEEIAIFSLSEALKKMGGEYDGWYKLANFVVQNYQEHLIGWRIHPLQKQNIITHLQKILQEPKVTSSFQFDGDYLISCCFNLITPDEKLQFPYFLVVAESHRNKRTAQKLLSTMLHHDALSIFYSSNPIVIKKCQTLYEGLSKDSHMQPYLLPIDAPAESLQSLTSITTHDTHTQYQGKLFNMHTISPKQPGIDLEQIKTPKPNK